MTDVVQFDNERARTLEMLDDLRKRFEKGECKAFVLVGLLENEAGDRYLRQQYVDTYSDGFELIGQLEVAKARLSDMVLYDEG